MTLIAPTLAVWGFRSRPRCCCPFIPVSQSVASQRGRAERAEADPLRDWCCIHWLGPPLLLVGKAEVISTGQCNTAEHRGATEMNGSNETESQRQPQLQRRDSSRNARLGEDLLLSRDARAASRSLPSVHAKKSLRLGFPLPFRLVSRPIPLPPGLFRCTKRDGS